MTFDEFQAEGSTGERNSDMLFRSHLSGPNGAYFELLKEKHHTEEDIARAKAWIKRNRDSTGIKIINHSNQPTQIR